MKTYYRYLCIVILSLSCFSCKKFLDVTPDGVGTIDYAFRNRNEAENYLFTCYHTLQQLDVSIYNPGFTTSAEIIFPDNLTSNYGLDPIGFHLIRGSQNSSDPVLNNWDGSSGGQPIWKAIRRCNIMLENIDKPIDLSDSEKRRWIAEVKFLKAYYHFYMLKMYGPIPIMDINSPINSSEEAVKVKRKPVDEVVNYIVSLLNEAAPDLPNAITNSIQELGRITRPIGLAVKAQVLATAASPLYNGNPDYASLKDKDGTSLFNPVYDPKKWDAAALACFEAIKASEDNGARLHKFVIPANIARLNDSLKTVLDLQTTITEKWDLNAELIWALNPEFKFQDLCGPRLTQNAAVSLVFLGTFAIPISQQELFYTHNGVPINEDKTWDYANRYDLRSGDHANRFFIADGYETVKAHFNRESRFYAAIAFDGGTWFGNGNFDQEKQQFVQGKGSASYAGPLDNTRINVTGYWPKKLVSYLTVHDMTASISGFHLPMIRLAGLYLLYAECLNEQAKPATEVVPYLDKVRERAGLHGVVEAWTNYSRTPAKYTTKDGMRQIIHQETRIELAFEGQGGWDLRRWKELQVVLSKPMQGWNTYEKDGLNYYKQRNVVIPVFNVRNYLWPISDNALIGNSNLVQNTGW
ncbi:RagB/SusD family nutrient uptake outer membrane protein [Pedobacter nyackensis]|uniref:RagB/SusD family nutrient uptake outer membrane protein n=1 Tax=Pedobacter nyackensis TaxID=475255 RepID=UPI00292E9DA6|nr:RagB/SusD family nutrient uptake outer membrane protein [Pedobacter nyackensis]